MRRWVSRLIVFQIAAVLLIAVTNLLPDGPILDHLADSRDAIEPNGIREMPNGGLADGNGECVTATVGIQGDEFSFFESVGASTNLGFCDALLQQLDRHDAGESVVVGTKVRYWNGLSVLSRPLLLFTDLSGVRLVATACLVAALSWLAIEASRVAGLAGAVAIVAPLVLTADLVGLTMVFHHTFMFAMALAGVAWLVRSAASGAPLDLLAFRVALVAAVYAFIDLMNFAAGVGLMTVGAVGLALPHGTALAHRVRVALVCGAVWPTSYVVTWASAWGWAALVRPPGRVWDTVTSRIEHRVNGTLPGDSGAFGSGAREVISTWLSFSLAEVFLLAFVFAFAFMVRRAVRLHGSITAMVVAIGPAAAIVPWILVANQHHETHAWIEFRNVSLLIALGLFAGAVAVTGRLAATVADG